MKGKKVYCVFKLVNKEYSNYWLLGVCETKDKAKEFALDNGLSWVGYKIEEWIIE